MGKAIRNHPALLTVFAYDPDGRLIQRYTPEIYEEIRVEKTREFEFEFLNVLFSFQDCNDMITAVGQPVSVYD